jgi:ribokinase
MSSVIPAHALAASARPSALGARMRGASWRRLGRVERPRRSLGSSPTSAPRLAVVGSANVDLVARCEQLPRPGETVTGASFARLPGGKGANQAVAAARLGARTRFVGRIGTDDLVLRSLEREGVDTSGVTRDEGESGVALILVDAGGENVIVVSPGANARLTPQDVDVGEADAVLCQLEIPDAAVRAAAVQARFFCLNAAPARGGLELEPDLLVVNRYEHEAVGAACGKLVALTLGAEGAVLLEAGRVVARAAPPDVHAVDGTGAGDAFCAALVVSLLEGRDHGEALRRACAAGALAASRAGAQASLPTARELDALLAP